jgi:hypothetical protein
VTDPQWLAALPQPVQEAVRLSLADLQQPAPVPLEIVRYQPDDADARFGLLVVRFADGTGLGFGVTADGDRADLVANVADQLQEAFCQEPDAWGEARPVCPGHTHPAFAVAIDGTACWVCPADGRPIGRIGERAAEVD